jgi:nucleotide-binding universal stress UspA family protein
MQTIKHILFPIDFSKRTCGAAPFVKSMAERFGARVTLMSVAAPIRYFGTEVVLPPEVFTDQEIKADLQLRLNGALHSELAGVPVEAIAEVGEPAEVITAFAHTQGVGLIMMPTHGYGPFRRLLLGSVTAKVLHDTNCPVWTGVHVADPPSRDHVTFGTVMCALDGTPAGVPVLQWAARFAQDAGAKLRCVHCIPGLGGGPERSLGYEFEQALRAKARTNMENIEELAGVKAPLCLVAGNVAGAVRDEAERHATDLIVIGRGLIHEKLGRLRTHAYGIIREAPCPVISV